MYPLKLNDVAMPATASLQVTPFDRIEEVYLDANGVEHVEYSARGKRKIYVRWEQLTQEKMSVIQSQLTDIIKVEVYDISGKVVTLNARVTGQSNSPYKWYGNIVKYPYYDLELTEL